MSSLELNEKGATKNVSLKAEYGGRMKDLWGNTKAGLSIREAINRKKIGLTGMPLRKQLVVWWVKKLN